MKAKKLSKPKQDGDVPAKELSGIYQRIREILESARAGVARTVNTTQVVANWLIGREIVEGEQAGERRARYGSRLLEGLAANLKEDFGEGYSVQNLRYMRQFHLEYPHLIDHSPIHHTLCGDSGNDKSASIPHTPCGELAPKSWSVEPLQASQWVPGLLHTGLAWSIYRHLIKVDSLDARAFYEIEAIKNNWSARELERQIHSLLFERLAKSKDKAGLMKLSIKGQEIATPADVFKDPVVIEFLGLPESHRLVESDLEQALINNLQAFLLELGRGFAFISRQERITLDGDHFYIDLVFYHAVLKCYVLIDLKVGKLTHGDLGQMQLYANYFDQERRTEGDNSTLGLILCTDKNDAVVRYLLGPDQSKKIFTSRYKLHLPSEAELATELKRELQQLR
jgi:predicted nuclease of restriction endonuclease-like (RecB) superfamily